MVGGCCSEPLIGIQARASDVVETSAGLGAKPLPWAEVRCGATVRYCEYPAAVPRGALAAFQPPDRA